jgi:DNA-binding transcriptional regulator of glucitol operon
MTRKLLSRKMFMAMVIALAVACWCGPAAAYNLTVTAYIDGYSRLIIQGNTVQWHNINDNAPGTESPYSLSDVAPTTLTTADMTVDWTPTWPADTKHNESDNDVYSDIFTPLTPPLPAMAQTLGLTVVTGRDYAGIFQQPSEGNGYTCIVEFADWDSSADWYTVELNSSQVPLPPAALLFGAGLIPLAWYRRRNLLGK